MGVVLRGEGCHDEHVGRNSEIRSGAGRLACAWSFDEEKEDVFTIEKERFSNCCASVSPVWPSANMAPAMPSIASRPLASSALSFVALVSGSSLYDVPKKPQP